MSNGITSYLKPADLHKLSRLVLQSRYLIEGNLSGRHRSPLIGMGGEFADHRDYVPGDDPKHIDWKVLSRTDRYYIRRYENETNLRVYLALDRSASMGYGTTGLTKYDYACYLATALGYVVVRGRDSVGLYLYSKRIDAKTGTRNSIGHLNNVVKIFQQQRPASTTDTAATLHQIADSIQRRALVVVLSDLLDPDSDAIAGALAHFRKNHHDVIVLHTLDPMELDLDAAKGGEYEDLETGERLIVEPRSLLADYRRLMGEFLARYQKMCLELRIDYRLVNTATPPETFVRAYLEERRRLSR